MKTLNNIVKSVERFENFVDDNLEKIGPITVGLVSAIGMYGILATAPEINWAYMVAPFIPPIPPFSALAVALEPKILSTIGMVGAAVSVGLFNYEISWLLCPK